MTPRSIEIRCTPYVVGICLLISTCVLGQTPAPNAGKEIALPSSKVVQAPVPGDARRLNSFPAASALSPDGRYVAILNQGWGLPDSKFEQSIAILDLQTNNLTDYPDERLHRQKQTYFYGLAWSQDSKRLFASISSLTNPEGKQEQRTDQRTGAITRVGEGDIGNGIAVFRFENGALSPERFVKIPPQPIGGNKKRAEALKAAPDGTTPAFPAGIAVVNSGAGEQLLIADNLSDDVLLLDPDDGRVIHRFDLSAHDFVPAEFPLNVVASRDGKRGWVSLWNGSAVGELDLDSGQVVRRVALLPPPSPTDPGSHPSALLLSRDEKWLYCTLSNADAVAVIESASGRIVRWVSTRLPKQRRPGVYPVALAQSPDGRLLYVADAAANAVEVFNPGRGGRLHRRGFIPTEWYPTSVVTTAADLVITSAKGQGTGPNSGAVKTTEGRIARSNHPYIFSLLGGSVARIKVAEAEPHLADLTRQVLESNRMQAQPAPRPWRKNPIRHVIYVIKENRSYDQVFGDIKEANGDLSLVMYGEEITPNHHKLARQFGVLDNFYVSGEVSGDGHVWSTAAIGSDYTEATIQINYRNGQRTYDYEGTNLDEVVLERGVPDVNEPGTSYLWTNAARHGVTYRDYGELIEGKWCNAAPAEPAECPEKIIEKGQPLPPNVGQPHGSPSPYPWKVPILGSSIATKKELRDHFDAKYAGWELDYPDQLRIDEFLNEFDGFLRAREQGSSGQMPALIVLRLPNDHTSGTRVGAPKPEAQVADNDLALGRLVEAVSHSPYWDDTAILVLEDDAQNGPDHVDAHRSPAFVISKYSRRSQAGPYVDSHFYTTVNMIRTVEDLVGLPPMNHNDAQAAPMWTMLSAEGSQPSYSADWRNRDNGLIFQVNASNAPGAAASAQLDFSHADAADAALLNEILWRAAKGEAAMPMSEHRSDIRDPARRR